MKVRCSYCDGFFDDTLTNCPHCGAASEGVNRKADGQPVTIEELQAWYAARGLPPYETTRFFIGVDTREARAFGIYKEPDSGSFVVYKNKADGQRAVRYRGTDEAYAVNELYQRLKQEIIEQKARQNQKKTSVRSASAGTQKKKKGNLGAILAILLIVMVIRGLLADDVAEGYYLYDDIPYYYLDSGSNQGWYTYSEGYDEWHYADGEELPPEFEKNSTAKDFYYTPEWDGETQIKDFESSDYYRYNEYDGDSDSDYDWDSGSGWDSGGTDWDSDW